MFTLMKKVSVSCVMGAPPAMGKWQRSRPSAWRTRLKKMALAMDQPKGFPDPLQEGGGRGEWRDREVREGARGVRGRRVWEEGLN